MLPDATNAAVWFLLFWHVAAMTANLAASDSPAPGGDPRNIRQGLPIPDRGYCDQPYIVVTPDGHWVCTMTTGSGREGERGQHVVATISTDQGRSWSELIEIEPPDGPEASWIVPLITPAGRIYGFYTYNGDDVRTLDGKPIRADVIGWYVFRYSDDGGRTWSAERHRLPLRVTACDRGNDFQGRVQIFWGIDKPSVIGSDVVFAFTKLGKYMLEQGEGWMFRSDNLLTERDPRKLRWELLPAGDRGIRNDAFGSVQEEHNVVPLNDRDLYCVYRTTLGYPAHAYSRDGGRSWTRPELMSYAPGGRRIKTPRACPMVWRTEDGKLLFWFHNNSEKSYQSRNPVWISGGTVHDGHVHWSQPEILLYDPDPQQRISYPDLIQQDGQFWISETQKTIARVHAVDRQLLEGLWAQGKSKTVSSDGLLLDLDAEQLGQAGHPLPRPLDLAQNSGLAIDVWFQLDDLAPGQVLLETGDDEGRGWTLSITAAGSLQIALNDGTSSVRWASDAGLIRAGSLHHAVVIADSGPRIISLMVDGQLCDGGETRDYGWTRFPEGLGDVSGSGLLRAGKMLRGSLRRVRLYDRYLRTSEAVAHYHAGPERME